MGSRKGKQSSLEIDLDINKIKDLPIIETVMRSIQQNSTVKTILKLGCSVLITYSKFRNQLIC